jgi:hypothetical protein
MINTSTISFIPSLPDPRSTLIHAILAIRIITWETDTFPALLKSIPLRLAQCDLPLPDEAQEPALVCRLA